MSGSYLLGRKAGWRAAALSGATADRVLRANTTASYRSTALDGRVNLCQWDRIRCSLSLDAGCSVGFSTYTSDTQRDDVAIDALEDAEWTAVPGAAAGPVDGSWDGLVLSPPGRFLWLRAALTGRAGAPAIVRWASIAFPRATSLRLLPAVFSTPDGGRDVTERLLALFDEMRAGVRSEIALLARILDPRRTDAAAGRDFLDWLGAWFDMEIFASWPVERRRAVVANAGRLFRRRGTCDGIELFVRLAMARGITILESFNDRRWWFAGATRLGCSVMFGRSLSNRARIDGPGVLNQEVVDSVPTPYLDPFALTANAITVVVAFDRDPTQDELRTLRLILDAQRPAHVAVELYPVGPDLRLGVSSRLGLDSVIGDLRPPTILPGDLSVRRLGVNTTLQGESPCRT